MVSSDKPTPSPRRPALWEALLPVVALIVFLGLTLGVLRLDGERLGDPHIPLLLGCAIAALMGARLGWDWDSLQEGMVRGISLGMSSILILLCIGILIGLWIAAGIVPLLIELGLQLLHPSFFLPATCLICAVVSVTTGSSWTTAGTVGVALIGVGELLGVSAPMAAGAIISGAYFGDKMSPLSDTTNLAPAVAGSELFEHIRHMAWTTVPSFLLALLLFSFLGTGGEPLSGPGHLSEFRNHLQSHYRLSPWLWLAPALVVFLILRKVPALPALLAGAAAGGVLAWALQGQSLAAVLDIAMNGYRSTTGSAAVDDLLSRGGMTSMFWTVALILCALAFGGLMERTDMLEVLAEGILRLARRVGGLIAATIFTCIGMNAVAPDQYLSIVVPGRMYKTAFSRMRLHPKNLSRVLEDAGTLTSPLILWNTCGATMFEVLGVSAFLYWRYCFFNLINPFVSLIYGLTGFKITPFEPSSSGTYPEDSSDSSTSNRSPHSA